MRKQLEEIKELDQYILHQLNNEDKLVMQTKIMLSSTLQENWWHQQVVHKIIRLFGREQKRKELNALHQRLMSDPDFKQQISLIFK